MQERLDTHQQTIETSFTDAVKKLSDTSAEVFIKSHVEPGKSFERMTNGIDLINHALRDLGQNKIPNEAKRKKGFFGK